jgi:AcrR family transcriptional regulator
MQKCSNPPIRQRRKEARPSELTAAALDLFVERGFAATKLDDVAARAGVSKGTLYLYFASKEELFKAVIQQGILPVVEQGEEMLSQHSGDAASLLRDLTYRWWELVGCTKLAGVVKLIISDAGNFPEVASYFHEHVTRRIDDLLGNILRQGMERGEFRRVDVASAIDAITSPILMRVIWQYSVQPYCCGGQKDSEIYMGTYIDLLLNGLTVKEQSHE